MAIDLVIGRFHHLSDLPCTILDCTVVLRLNIHSSNTVNTSLSLPHPAVLLLFFLVDLPVLYVLPVASLNLLLSFFTSLSYPPSPLLPSYRIP